jgi:tetratricopeptide (TPR) repeat protein
MKIYLHYDSDIQAEFGTTDKELDVSSLHECTFIFQFNGGGVEVIVKYFLEQYVSKFGSTGVLETGDVGLVSGDKVLTTPGILKEKDDVFLFIKSRVGGASKVDSKLNPKADSKVKSKVEAKLDTGKDAVKGKIKKAKKHFEAKQYKKARVLCEGILKEDKGNRDALRILGDIDFRNGKWERSLETYRRAVKSWGVADGGDMLLSDKISLARCLMKTAQYEDALDVLEEVTDAMKTMTRKAGKYSLDDAVIFIAVCHKELGKLVESAAITEMIIKRDQAHFAGLFNYADVAGRMGKHQDAVGILMRCIVMDQQNEEVKRLLGEELGREDGVENMKK